ncbi:MAG: Glucose-1-phosphate adenylyltransferase [Candidatus Bipolaricaulis sibiricus]|uniref:Glucose-1-phosphate adenylyltransferase n=1 Tax=Bipolaricaulis sibiricus TaxID=2501609 RepID=A0A410FUS9_BIPS1|nr:MAG: Glucose-1-phosphate adenylyltransferase [Candidatus Bipolaricaulis sibiricus]
MTQVLTFVMAGGRGERLHPLTRDRAKPAVPFAGLYRIIDFTLTNCLHSGLRHILVLTQYKSLSLERHLHHGWSLFSQALGEFLIAVPPQQRTAEHWYLGTADAIWQNWYSVERFAMERGAPNAILILAGDHVYKMDYRPMVQFHREHDADLTVGVLSVPLPEAAGQLGVLAVDEGLRVQRFQEKPAEPAPSPENPAVCLASMGIYVFRPEVLARRLEEDAAIPTSSHDFGKDVINRMVGEDRVFAFPFERGNRNPVPYWRDVGTLDAYWEAHMDLVAITPLFNLYDREWPIHTYHEPWPPAKTVHEEPGRTGTAVSSLLSPGCIVSGSTVVRSILSPGVRVNSFATVEESVLLSGVDVGRGARVRRTIVDKGARIPPGESVGYNVDQDRERFTVTDRGIVVIPKEARF